MTRQQKQHAREQRALLRLRKAAVMYSVVDQGPVTFAELTAACDAYANAITGREARKLGATAALLRKLAEEEL